MKLYALPSLTQPVAAVKVKKRPMFAGDESSEPVKQLKEKFLNDGYSYYNFKPAELHEIASHTYWVDALVQQLNQYFQEFPQKGVSVLPRAVKALSKLVWLTKTRETLKNTTFEINQRDYSNHYDAMKALESDFGMQQWWAEKQK